MHILYYLAGSRTEGLHYYSNRKFAPSLCADASHHLYPEGHGQIGFLIMNGSSPVGYRSGKIRLITRSSSESELYGAEESSTYAVWYKQLLGDMGRDVLGPIILYQDNLSTIIMAIRGGTFQRTKHLTARATYLRERIAAGDIQLKHRPTRDMEADLLTKPVSKAVLIHLKEKMCIRPTN